MAIRKIPRSGSFATEEVGIVSHLLTGFEAMRYERHGAGTLLVAGSSSWSAASEMDADGLGEFSSYGGSGEIGSITGAKDSVWCCQSPAGASIINFETSSLLFGKSSSVKTVF